MYKPIKVKALKDYRLWVKYEDGSEGEVDISHLSGKGVFKIWGKGGFEKVYIDKDTNAIAWSNKVDICPDNIYYKINNISPETKAYKKVG